MTFDEGVTPQKIDGFLLSKNPKPIKATKWSVPTTPAAILQPQTFQRGVDPRQIRGARPRSTQMPNVWRSLA